MESTGLPEPAATATANTPTGRQPAPTYDHELDKFGNKTPVGTRPAELGQVGASMLPNKEHVFFKNDHRSPGSVLATADDDSGVSVCSSSGPTRSNTNVSLSTGATSVNTDEPRFDDPGYVSLERVRTLPVRCPDRVPLRSDSIDSETAFGFTRVSRQLWRLQHSTFPRNSSRHGSSEQPHKPSSLRTTSTQSPPSTITERDSSQDDDTDITEIMEEPDPMCDNDKASSTIPHRLEADDDDDGDDDNDKEMAIDVSSSDGSVESQPLRNRLPEGGLLEHFCNYILQTGFNIEFSELKGRPQALEAIARCWHELSVVVDAEDGPACDGPDQHATGTHPVSGFGGFGNGGGWGRKRLRDNAGGSGEGGHNSNDNGQGDDNSVGSSSFKRLRVQSRQEKLTCPFRKRNPLRFNVRDHLTCATMWYKDISSVKRHVKTFHARAPRSQPMFVCPRCKEALGSRELLEQHLGVPADSMCKPQGHDSGNQGSDYDPEDGISDVVEAALCDRSNSHKINSWELLWNRLFHGEPAKAPDFCPPIELEEVEQRFQEDSPCLIDRLRAHQASTHEFSVLDESSLIDLQIAHDGFQEFIKETFESCRKSIERPLSAPSRRRNGKQAHINTPSTPSSLSAAPVHLENQQQQAPVEIPSDFTPVSNNVDAFSSLQYLGPGPYQAYPMTNHYNISLEESSVYLVPTTESGLGSARGVPVSVSPLQLQPDMLTELEAMRGLPAGGASPGIRENEASFGRPIFQNDTFCTTNPEFKERDQESSKDTNSWDQVEEYPGSRIQQ